MQLELFEGDNKAYLVENFSADSLCEQSSRRSLEKKFAAKMHITEQFNRQSVSYQLSKKEALHRWLKYKEGFSADLVNTILNEAGIKEGDCVMDPFMGSGTTALVCQMRGVNSIGYDIMPMSEVAIKVKSFALQYDTDEIQRLIDEVKALQLPSQYPYKISQIVITEDAYPEKTQKFLHFIQEWNRLSSYSEEVKLLLTLCIVNSLETISYTVKSGQYLGWDSRSLKVQRANESRAQKGQKLLPLKTVRKIIPEAQAVIVEELEKVLSDIVYIQQNTSTNFGGKIDFTLRSVLYELPLLEENRLNAVVTSPPYCNRYDYTRTYALELVYLGLGEQDIRKMRQTLLSCTVENKSKMDELQQYYEHINHADRFKYIKNTLDSISVLTEIKEALKVREARGDLNNKGVLRMVEGYFIELGFIYAELFRTCRPGALVAFVNDNVRYGGEVIPVDFISCEMAEAFGFSVKKIYVLKQQKGNSSQQMARFGRVPLRKSITIWQKNEG